MTRFRMVGAAACMLLGCDVLWVDALPAFVADVAYGSGDLGSALDVGYGSGDLGSAVQDPSTIKMVPVPAGPFQMGCNEAVDGDCDSDELPYHEVTLDAYEIDETEVTVAAYAACVQAGACAEPDTGYNGCNWGAADRAEHPVNCVDWGQAGAYCAWAGKRLPTEAEWEKAARGTDGRRYPWGNATASCDFAVMYDGGVGCGTGTTWPVGSKPAGASPCGALDMAGNVWEWVADRYDSGYYASSPETNPQGPSSGSDRVGRGGGFGYDAAALRVSNRDYAPPGYAGGGLGFRCARSNP